MTVALSLTGAIVYPAATGALKDLYQRPTDPFGAMEVVSTHRAAVELCYEFARRRAPCDRDALDPQQHREFVARPALSVTRSNRLARDVLIGGLTPIVAAIAFGSIWRLFIATCGWRRPKAEPAASSEIFSLARARE